MRQKSLWTGLILLLLFQFLPQPVAQAQSTTPQLQTLIVELWPEYDRPETLVIYRAELNPATTLPTQLTFQLPGYVEKMHAVAIEQNGTLVDIDPQTIDLRHEGDDLFLTFPTASPNVHFEYYDPIILTKQNQTRELAFQFPVPYSIETAIFQVQEPYQAIDFSLTPDPSNTFVGRDSLKYHSIERSGLVPEDTFALSAAYNRDTDELSVQKLSDSATSSLVEPSTTVEAPPNETLSLGYLLIGAGVLLIIATAGYWWWSKQKVAEPDLVHHRRAPRPGRRRTKSQDKSTPASGYCYRCGAALRADANFCHSCGAERRKD